ncbi:GDSL-type esterase/lipase family protein [Streptomyces crystallinus]|uniref:SGNH hydrolase-type esterase domain-containing protein n=1 Tax=Streptomyces crystallinus TaxID=68191 RepID=A0ABP3QNA9_9ACTN
MIEDIRICFVGDSFVQGVGDPEYRGWIGRVLEATGEGMTAFNLGLRRDTSEDVLQRWRREALPRFLPGADNRLVVSFGSNDMVEEGGAVRVEAARCVRNLELLLDGCRDRGVTPFVVGPPPVADAGDAHLRRTVALADAMEGACRERYVPFVATTSELAADPVWTGEALAGDGAHPGGGGYGRLAALVLAGQWHEWIRQPLRDS